MSYSELGSDDTKPDKQKRDMDYPVLRDEKGKVTGRRYKTSVIIRRNCLRFWTINGLLISIWNFFLTIPATAVKMFVGVTWIPFVQKLIASHIGWHEFVDGDTWDVFIYTLYMTMFVASMCVGLAVVPTLYSWSRDAYREVNRYRFIKLMAESSNPYQFGYDWPYFSDEDPDEAAVFYLTREVNEDFQSCCRPENWTYRRPAGFDLKKNRKVHRNFERVHAIALPRLNPV